MGPVASAPARTNGELACAAWTFCRMVHFDGARTSQFV